MSPRRLKSVVQKSKVIEQPLPSAATCATAAGPQGSGVSSAGLNAVLAGDEAAWRNFVAQYDGPLRAVVRHATEATDPLTDDEIDDVLGDFWLAVVANDKRMLRAFNPTRGSALLTWLTFHVAHIACERVVQRAEAPTFVPLHEARNVHAPRSDRSPRLRNEARAETRSGVIDLRKELVGALDSVDAKRVIADIVRETMRAERARPAPTGDDALINATAAATMLAMTPTAVRKAALRGTLPCRRLGRKLRFIGSELLALARPSPASHFRQRSVVAGI